MKTALAIIVLLLCTFFSYESLAAKSAPAPAVYLNAVSKPTNSAPPYSEEVDNLEKVFAS